VTDSFVVAPLSDRHDRSTFSCGVERLDRYFKAQVGQDVRRRVANCYVAAQVNTNDVAGYYTFSAATVLLEGLPQEETKRLPRYPIVPAGLIGRLAIDLRFRAKGLGAALISDAIKRATRAGAAMYALVVDAKDEAAANFYRHHGFRPLNRFPGSLYLPIKTALNLLDTLGNRSS
jgi:GNAT superfamily N-acetyltransferase